MEIKDKREEFLKQRNENANFRPFSFLVGALSPFKKSAYSVVLSSEKFCAILPSFDTDT